MDAKTEVGKLGPGEMFNEGGMLYFEDLSPEIQALINNAEANEAKLVEQKRWLDAIWASFVAIGVGYGSEELGPEEALEAQVEGGKQQCLDAIKAISSC